MSKALVGLWHILWGWVRDTCLGAESVKRSYKPVEPLLLRELGKKGNLNQIAKHANTDALGDKIDRLRLLGELAVIREQLDELLKRYDDSIGN
ncbi:MobC family plasmid mobilization relaxosome protein [Moraxella haemolytica]|uniref:plasmid mobilization relaxosome protein MobC n=1 Tax=Moraxella haemolytica TaxID=2904119 RepID=UPI00254362B3|nr:plasmid mobilization relaxosome protein MobC [Moraxella sp. ZY171148]WII95206.1 MobC family plasmid mobilization relaxosome protein [Moraxella sp. ZY171148]